MNNDSEPARRRLRKNHPLVHRLREIRKRHRKTLLQMEACMRIPFDTLKQIEEGIRPLPGIIGDRRIALGPWFSLWMDCVEATAKEREEIQNMLVSLVLGVWTDSLPDANQAE